MNKEEFNHQSADVDVKAQLTVYATYSAALRCYELIAVLAWRIGFLCLIGAAMVAALAYLVNVRELGLGLGWVIVSSLQIGCLVLLGRSRNETQILKLALLLALSLLLWWGLIVVFVREPAMLPELFLGFLLLEIAVLPWPIKYFLIYSGTTVSLYAIWSLAGTYSALGLLVLVIVLPAALRNACINRINFHSRLANLILIESCKQAPDTETIVQLLAWELARITDVPAILVSYPGSQGKVLRGDEFVPSSVDAVFEKGLVHSAENSRLEDGILNSRELGQQYYAPLSDWFGRLPSDVFFSHLTGVIDAEERNIYIFCPIDWMLKLVGKKRCLLAVASVASIARIALAYQRSRFISSGVLSSTQRSISDQERELDQIIHRVNNAAQDISVICDGVTGTLKQELASTLSPELRHSLQRDFNGIENAITTLSSDVSDKKLLREMLQIRSLERFELVSLAPVIEQMRMYAQHRLERRSVNFVFENTVTQDLVIKVVSTALLGTALRLLLRFALRRCSKQDARVRMIVSMEGEQVAFKLEDNCEPLSSTLIEQINTKGAKLDQDQAALEYLRPVIVFVQASQGSLAYLKAAEPYVNCLECRFNARTRVVESTPMLNNWALLVDDNSEVTTFYARIADALKLRYSTAASVSEALKIIETNGKPRLVITDIQLGDSSGLDLVRDLRKQFGAALPVIVVSGKADESLAATIQRAGATTYLTKPVGRQRLFAEIQEVLSR